MYLIFDCTADEKVKDYKVPFSDTFAWPKLVHLSWILLGEDMKPIEDFDGIVDDEMLKITPGIMKSSKIDTEDIEKKKIPTRDLLSKFNESVEKCTYIFSHNLALNENVLAAEFMRQSHPIGMFKKERFCLMQESTYYCKLPSKFGGYKWPSLTELHGTCFNSVYTPPNNARADVIAATRCFIKLMRGNHLQDLFEKDDDED